MALLMQTVLGGLDLSRCIYKQEEKEIAIAHYLCAKLNALIHTVGVRLHVCAWLLLMSRWQSVE